MLICRLSWLPSIFASFLLCDCSNILLVYTSATFLAYCTAYCFFPGQPFLWHEIQPSLFQIWKLLLYKPFGFPCLFFSKAHRLGSFSATCSLSSYAKIANRGTSNFKIFRIKGACSASSSTSLSDSSLAHLSASSSSPPLYTIQLYPQSDWSR